jgi:bifunctional DNase/RNase
MQDLILSGMSWCVHHGCPVVSLQPMDGDGLFWITFSAEEAEAMAADPVGGPRGAARAYQLLERVTDWLDAQVSEVRLRRDGSGTLCASVTLEQPGRGCLVSVTEGIVLAWRYKSPVRIDDDTLAHIRRWLVPAGSFHSDATDIAGSTTREDELLAPNIIDFIQSLDFDGPDAPAVR